MKLFNEEYSPDKNLLPHDGIVNYYGIIFNEQSCIDFFNVLKNTIEWKNDEAFIFGKHYITKRKVAWYGDQPFEYAYSNVKKRALLWTKELKIIKNKVEEITHHSYNSCLLNLYHSGEEGMTYHSDDEKDLLPEGAIASVSFGAERRFSFKHKSDGTTVHMPLENGSLLVMKGACQQHWKHRLPPTKKIKSARINLTFRTIIGA